MIAIYLLAIIGLFAVIGGIRQWWINPKRKLNRSIKQMERAERRIQKFKKKSQASRIGPVELTESVELVQQNWSSRIGAKLVQQNWCQIGPVELVPNWDFSRPTNTGRHSRIRKLKLFDPPKTLSICDSQGCLGNLSPTTLIDILI